MNYALTASDPRFLPLLNTLTELGSAQADTAGLTQGYSEALVGYGLPLDRATTHIGTLHSEHIGSGMVWMNGKEVQEQHFDFGTRNGELFLNSAVKVVEDRGELLELWPKRDLDNPVNVLPDLRAGGIHHYLAYPLHFSDGAVNVASFATRAETGFSPRDRALLEALLPFYTQALELKSLRGTMEDILKIYVGREPATQILSGNIKRGQVSRMSAAILMADLRNFTELSNRLPARKLVQILNAFFDCYVPPIVAEGGEVLKFIGDAVLAIFPQPDGMAAVSSPSERALSAAQQGLANMEALNRSLTDDPAHLGSGVALHQGRVAFGNVGSIERQDFTAIGPDVNLAARIATLCGELGQPLLLSERFAKGSELPLIDQGTHRLKGFAQRQRVFSMEGFSL
ncbi:MAG: adenylate/guanylate cyclase domain-containing protein [Pseudomonadota bacterium]